jgi:hypothetical protein
VAAADQGAQAALGRYGAERVMHCHEVRLHQHQGHAGAAQGWAVEYEGTMRRATSLLAATKIACRIAVVNRGWHGEPTTISIRGADGAWRTLVTVDSGNRHAAA